MDTDVTSTLMRAFIQTGTFAHGRTDKYEVPTLPIKEGIHFLVPQLSEKEVTDLDTFIRKSLVLQPENRATASQLLDDEWLKAA